MTNSIELFVGAGGLAMGFEQAGYKPLMSVEKNQFACETLRHNRDWPIYSDDVRNFDYAPFSETVDLVTGGPPCQPFSLGGKHRGYNDSRDMFPEAVRAVRELRPRAFVFENVRGLLRQSFARYFEYVYLQLSYPEIVRIPDEDWTAHLMRLERHKTGKRYTGLRYNVLFQLLNAADYGVPQKRYRVFLVGFRSDVKANWSFPEPTHGEAELHACQWLSESYWDRHKIAKGDRPERPRTIRKSHPNLFRSLSPWRTVRDAIGDLPDPRQPAARHIANHIFSPGARSYPGHTGSPLDEPAKTLKAGDHGVPGGENMLRHPDGSIRYFTIREAARIQTFPDDYVFPGTWSEAMRQLGNAVPVNLAGAIAHSVRSTLSQKGSA